MSSVSLELTVGFGVENAAMDVNATVHSQTAKIVLIPMIYSLKVTKFQCKQGVRCLHIPHSGDSSGNPYFSDTFLGDLRIETTKNGPGFGFQVGRLTRCS